MNKFKLIKQKSWEVFPYIYSKITMLKKNTSMINISAIVAAIVWTVIMAGLSFWGIENEKEQTYELSKHQARAFFQEIVTTRSWNSTHGGVYVPITSETQPNPYLEDPERDVVTLEGVKLTKINPAYMTRQIGEIAAKKNLTWFHITSANPIRPANVPDQWESNALNLFSSGIPEFSEFIRENDGKIFFRYMGPLWVESDCLRCHSSQGYKEGDLRGGISVTTSADSILEVQKEAINNLTFAYTSIWFIGLWGIFIGYRLLKKEESNRLVVIADLEESISKVNKLSGLLPICASCKKIRDDKGYWNQIESYIRDHSDAEFSHGICPECTKKLYPDLFDD